MVAHLAQQSLPFLHDALQAFHMYRTICDMMLADGTHRLAARPVRVSRSGMA